MENVAIYARMSQDRSGLQAGVQRQIEDSQALAAREDLNVISIHTDNDTSATTGVKRPGWDEVLALVKARKISGIVVWHTDRLYRKVRDLAVLLDLAEKFDLKIHAVSAGDIDLSNPTGRMLATMIAGAASFEVEQKSARSARKNLDTATRGGYHGGPVPMGYRKGRTTGTLELDDAQALVLREAASRLIHGDTLNAVTRMAREGLGRPRLTPGSLKDALTRPTIAGFRRHVSVKERKDWSAKKDTEGLSGNLPENVRLYPAQWEPVLSYDEWQDVRHVLLVEERKRGRRPEKSLLSGVLICEICYTRLGYSTQAYKCPAQARHGCSGLAISTKAIEGLVSSYVKAGLIAHKREAEPLPPIKIDRSELEAMENTRKQFLELFRRRRITDAELNQQLDILDREMQKFEKQEIEAHRRRVVTERAKRIDRTTWDDNDLATQRDIVAALFPDGITIFKTLGGHKSGAKFNPSRVYLGPPPWLNERLPEPERLSFAQAREDRLAGREPSPLVSPVPTMTPEEKAAHDVAFLEWQAEMDELTN